MDLSQYSTEELMKMRSSPAVDLSQYSNEDLMKMRSQSAQPKKNRNWSDVPGEAISNIPKSAGNFASGVYQTLRHPIDTASNLLDLGAGALQNALPESVTNFVNKFNPNPEATKRAVNTADQVGQFYKNRYGTIEGFKEALATDPVGIAADLSMVAGGGAGIASRVPGASKVSTTLGKTSQYTNPVNAVAPIVKGTTNAVSSAGKNVLGLTTQTGPENLANAAKSGYNNRPEFMQNLKGEVPMTNVLDDMKSNIQNMKIQKSDEYRSNMIAVKADKNVLGFTGIDDAINNADQMAKFKGQIKNAKAAEVVQKIESEVSDWKKLNPNEFHTPEGLDALKQKVGGILESIPYEEKTARLAAQNIYNSIKSEITKQAPVYAKTMQSYEEASDLIREIEKSLSLGNKTSADTAMRKLQSLTRNNVNSNYGNRLDLAKTLQEKGGTDIMAALSGQAMNSWTPRGLAGQAEGIATLGAAAMHNPVILGLLPFQSPKAVGAALYGGGHAVRSVHDLLGSARQNPAGAKIADLLKNIQPEQAAMLLYQAQQSKQ